MVRRNQMKQRAVGRYQEGGYRGSAGHSHSQAARQVAPPKRLAQPESLSDAGVIVSMQLVAQFGFFQPTAAAVFKSDQYFLLCLNTKAGQARLSCHRYTRTTRRPGRRRCPAQSRLTKRHPPPTNREHIPRPSSRPALRDRSAACESCRLCRLRLHALQNLELNLHKFLKLVAG